MPASDAPTTTVFLARQGRKDEARAQLAEIDKRLAKTHSHFRKEAKRWRDFAAAAVGGWALKRYLFVLMRAEHLARQAVCPNCQVYARWRVEAEPGPDHEAQPLRMAVHCTPCGHHWLIEL